MYCLDSLDFRMFAQLPRNSTQACTCMLMHFAVPAPVPPALLFSVPPSRPLSPCAADGLAVIPPIHPCSSYTPECSWHIHVLLDADTAETCPYSVQSTGAQVCPLTFYTASRLSWRSRRK